MDRQTQFVNAARVEGKMLRAAAGGYILQRVNNYLEKQYCYSRLASIDRILVAAMCLIDDAAKKCCNEYANTMKEYSEQL